MVVLALLLHACGGGAASDGGSSGDTLVTDAAQDAFPSDATTGDAPVQPTLTPPASCAPDFVVTDIIYTAIIMPRCTTGGCHSPGAAPPIFTPGVDAFRRAVIGVPADRLQLPRLLEVAPRDPDNSLLLYKVLGQQDRVPAGGAREPRGAAPLSLAEQCMLYNWVQLGAL